MESNKKETRKARPEITHFDLDVFFRAPLPEDPLFFACFAAAYFSNDLPRLLARATASDRFRPDLGAAPVALVERLLGLAGLAGVMRTCTSAGRVEGSRDTGALLLLDRPRSATVFEVDLM